MPKARVRVEGTNELPVTLQCRQCSLAPCLDSCLTGALFREPESGTVVIRESHCIGCWTCTLFCPYGVIYPWPERKIALKCDRCLYMETPVCVDVCPTRALELVDLADYDAFLQDRQARTVAELQELSGTGDVLLLDVVTVDER